MVGSERLTWKNMLGGKVHACSSFKHKALQSPSSDTQTVECTVPCYQDNKQAVHYLSALLCTIISGWQGSSAYKHTSQDLPPKKEKFHW